MARQVANARPGACVNVLKKVRTKEGWRLSPVVRESNGRLGDRVRVNGHTEVHSEGVCYLEWREDGRRLREAIPNRAEELERARLKSLELEARKAGSFPMGFGLQRRPGPIPRQHLPRQARSCWDIGYVRCRQFRPARSLSLGTPV
jgi:hypothetical protein